MLDLLVALTFNALGPAVMSGVVSYVGFLAPWDVIDYRIMYYHLDSVLLARTGLINNC